MRAPKFVRDKMSSWSDKQLAMYKEALSFGWDSVAAAQYADNSIKNNSSSYNDDEDDDELFDEYLETMSTCQ